MAGRGRYAKAVLAVSVVVAPLFSIPVAGAVPTCQEAGTTVRCETNGSVSIKAVPTPRAPLATDTNRRRSGIVFSW